MLLEWREEVEVKNKYEIRCSKCQAKLAETERNPAEFKFKLLIKCKRCKTVNTI